MEDIENRKVHDFLTVSELDDFNDKVNAIVNKKPLNDKEAAEIAKQEIPKIESKPHETFIVNPKEVSEDLLYLLADIIDRKTHFAKEDVSQKIEGAPNSHDRILNALVVAYITEENLPIAVSILIDPTVENYKYIIPSDYYELKSGISLEERIEQDFFAFKPEKYTIELGNELKNLLMSNSPNLFIINYTSDTLTHKYLSECKYKLISTFNTDWDKTPVELWIN